MKKGIFSLSIIFLMVLTCVCIGADDLSIARDYSYDEGSRTLSFIINDSRTAGTEPNRAEVSFDGTALENALYKTSPDSGLPMVFCFVVDTTPTAFSYQTRLPGQIAEALAGYRGNKEDKYFLISYDTEVHEAAGPVQNPESLFDGIKYAGGYNIVGDHSEALMKAVELLDAYEGFCKKVIILITDGNQTDRPFLQDEGEDGLLERLEKAGYPVYAAGLMQSETEDYAEASLKKIRNLCSAAGGMYISYKDNPNPEKDFYDQMTRSGVISGTIPASYGKETAGPLAMTVRLLRSSGTEIGTLTADIVLPAIEGPAATAAEEEKEEPVVLQTEEPALPPQEQTKNLLQEKLGDNWAYILGGVLAAIILIIIILAAAGKSRKAKKNKGAKDVSSDRGSKPESVTEIVPEPKHEEQKPPEAKGYLAYVTDQSTGVTCSASLRDGQTVRYGRLNDKANAVIGLGGDPHISRKQFTLTNDSGKIILEDSGSENGTFLNGERISGKAAVNTGDMIRVGGIPGEREFRVSLMEL